MSSPLCAVYDKTLGGTRPRRHIAPQIRTAGLVIDGDSGTVAELTSNHYSSGRVTPELIRSHRRAGEVGCTRRHYGFARDPPLDETFCHGVKNPVSEGAGQCLQPTKNALTSVMEEQLERTYQSYIRRPLGHCPAPLYDVPVPRGGFGIRSDVGESVKRIIFCGKDVDVLHPAGERKDRGYDWETIGIDPTRHRFGVTTVKNAARPGDVSQDNQTATTLLPKLVGDFQTTVKAELGKPRTYGFNNAPFEEIAKKRAIQRSRHGDGDAAREVLSSWAVHPETLKAQELLAARRAASKCEEMGDSFNTTAVVGSDGDGHDRSKYLSRFSCTFGSKRGGGVVALSELDDNVRAPHLLYPSHYVQLGVKSEYFAGGRSLEDIRRLCKKVDFGLSDLQIDEVFATIAVEGKCGIEQFKNKAVEMGYLA